MLRKLQKKILLISKLYRVGADFNSSLTLVFQLLLLSLGRYVGFVARPFSCNVAVAGRSSRMHFIGTMGELLTLVDIFADSNYAPYSHTDREVVLDTILDLGANIGIATVWFALYYPKATIHAYEPNPQMFALLKKNTATFPQIRIFESAIADKEGTVTFNQSIHFLESSIFEARDSKAISVAASTIDQAIGSIGDSVDYMKIDIEGAEFEAFAASTKLNKVQAIVGEAHTQQAGHEQHELLELLSSFNIIKIYNPNNDTVFGFYADRVSSPVQ